MCVHRRSGVLCGSCAVVMDSACDPRVRQMWCGAAHLLHPGHLPCRTWRVNLGGDNISSFVLWLRLGWTGHPRGQRL